MTKGFSLSELMNTQSKPERQKPSFEVQEIPIEQLSPSEKNEYGLRDIEALAASIESMGLMHNLLVKPVNEKGLYEIISGERRYRACLLLHEANPAMFARIPCKVAEPGSDTLDELKLIYANATARELTDFEKTYQAGRIKALLLQLKAEGYRFQGRMREIVADLLKVSPAQMGRMESIHDHLTDGFKDEFARGNIGISTAYDASTLPLEQQHAALQAYRAGQPEAVRQAVRDARAGKSDSPVVQYEPATPADFQPADQLPAPGKPLLSDLLRGETTAEAHRLAHRLRRVAAGIPYDAVCADEQDEINIRATLLNAARTLEELSGAGQQRPVVR